MNQKSETEIKKLEFIIGKWNTQGTIRATDTSQELKINGTDTYEYVSNGFFILHTVNVMMGSESVESIEIIGFDETIQKYQMQSFDNSGNITFMNGAFNDKNAFLLIGEKQRATLTVNIAFSEMKAYWEQSEDGINWIPWMDITFSK
jgi:hypothetical protein